MSQFRFILDCDLDQKEIDITEPRVVSQLGKVLRARIGEAVFLSNGKTEREVKAEIVEINKDSLKVKVLEVYKKKMEPEIKLTLFTSIIKKDRLEWLVEKATEIGVSRIVPLVADRTVKLDFKKERLEKIALEATEQSGRTIVPEISEKITFKEALKETKNFDLNHFFSTSDSDKENSKTQGKNRKNISVFIGPEGDWSEEEIKLAQEYNLTFATLGKTILRSETAGIAATSLILLDK